MRIEYLMFSNDPNKNLAFIFFKKELPLQYIVKIKFTLVMKVILDFCPETVLEVTKEAERRNIREYRQGCARRRKVERGKKAGLRRANQGDHMLLLFQRVNLERYGSDKVKEIKTFFLIEAAREVKLDVKKNEQINV